MFMSCPFREGGQRGSGAAMPPPPLPEAADDVDDGEPATFNGTTGSLVNVLFVSS